MIEMDEDLIRGYYCPHCERNFCKDEYFKKYEDGTIMCIYCAEKKGLMK